MEKEMPKAFEAAEYEGDIYRRWEESGLFDPDNYEHEKGVGSYSIVLPPPNVTGVLHLGHASVLALEDILTRFHRMKGERTLWVPGTDHAAIATQTKVEKIIKEEGQSRHTLGKEKFLERVRQFAQDSHDTIVNQCKRMGASCDWSREAYTLDETRNRAVNSVFKLMYDDGLIYRGERVVNWCPRCHSTLADDEVEYKEQKAKLYTFKYSADFPFAISTTRPETKLGDTAVAVNPKDARFKDYVGKIFDVNFCGISLSLKIIADRNVEMEFGTGALGVTPAHSAVDWKMGEDNGLTVVKVIDEDGMIKEGFGAFSGKSAVEAREMVAEDLRKSGLMISEEEVDNKLSLCYRCDTPIEPLPSLQWFIDMNKPLGKFKGRSIKDICLEVVEQGFLGDGEKKISIYPERFKADYLRWMNNLHDWCISRQILFGHQIPVWYQKNEEVGSQKSEVNDASIYVGIDAPAPTGSLREGDGWVRDGDTLDTWFSSGLWTFSTMAKKPEDIRIENGKIVVDTEDFRNFHPVSVMETAYDILFFWVARMIIMTTYSIEDIPFKDVYLNGLVLDEKGKKMSKSKGNTIDPLEMSDKYGTDAVRLALVIGSTPGNDLRLSEEKIASFRNLINKIWNISRFVKSNYELQITNYELDKESLTIADKWILRKMGDLINRVDKGLHNYEFSQVGEALREFTWNDLADWYLEAAKFEKSKNKEVILGQLLMDLLKLWHPYIPFVTESVWDGLGMEGMLIAARMPSVKFYEGFSDDADKFEIIKDIIIAVRNARSENKIEPARKIDSFIYAKDITDMVSSQAHLIKGLRTGIGSLEISERGEKKDNAIYAVVGKAEIYLVGAVDEEKEAERKKKDVERLRSYIGALESKLANKEFISRAPANIVDAEKKKLAEAKEELSLLE